MSFPNQDWNQISGGRNGHSVQTLGTLEHRGEVHVLPVLTPTSVLLTVPACRLTRADSPGGSTARAAVPPIMLAELDFADATRRTAYRIAGTH